MKHLKIKEKLFKDKVAKHIKFPINQPYNPYNNIYTSSSKLTNAPENKNSTNKLVDKFNSVEHHRNRSDDPSYLNSNDKGNYDDSSRNTNNIFPYQVSKNIHSDLSLLLKNNVNS